MIFFFAVCVSNTAFSQLRCGAMERWQMEVKNNPELRENRSLVEEKIKQFSENEVKNPSSTLIAQVFSVESDAQKN